ncbi:MAG: L-fucose/L-arabinose isomerase family protein [Gemmatimonadaceae bacterium]
MTVHHITTKDGRTSAPLPSPMARRPMEPKRPTLGVVVGNRGFFPGHLVQKGREDILATLSGMGVDVVALSTEDARYGAVESRDEAKACAALFRAHIDRIDGIVVTLPNFGDERAIAEALRLSGLKVPVLIQATADAPDRMTIKDRRDSFCGKMSACNVLSQYGIPYSLTRLHTVDPTSETFRADVRRFLGICRVVNGLRTARVGAIGARPAAFKTVRYSEKLLEASGIAVETIDLSEVLGRIQRLPDDAPATKAKLEQMRSYVPIAGVPDAALLKQAKLGVVLDDWMVEADVQVSAVQCWTAIEEYFGVVPCTVMSMMSNELAPSACEVDVCGTLAMYALALASNTPSALLDWNNNYGDDPNKAVCFHCSNLPKHFFADVRMDYQEIIAGTVGRDNTYGTVVGRVRPSPMTFARFSTDDRTGRIRGYVGEGRFTEDELETFGGAGVVEIPHLQRLLHYICEQGFEHHVAANLSSVADIVEEACTGYLGWDIHHHR